MRRIVFTLALFLGTVSLAQERLIDYVNPFIGTDGFGNVYPGAQIPFGGIQISPDTDDFDYDVAAGYKYNKPTIMGFSLTHLSGTGRDGRRPRQRLPLPLQPQPGSRLAGLLYG